MLASLIVITIVVAVVLIYCTHMQTAAVNNIRAPFFGTFQENVLHTTRAHRCSAMPMIVVEETVRLNDDTSPGQRRRRM
jgi:hypothetical protein